MTPLWTRVAIREWPNEQYLITRTGTLRIFSDKAGTKWFATVDGGKPIELKAYSETAARREILRIRAHRAA